MAPWPGPMNRPELSKNILPPPPIILLPFPVEIRASERWCCVPCGYCRCYPHPGSNRPSSQINNNTRPVDRDKTLPDVLLKKFVLLSSTFVSGAFVKALAGRRIQLGHKDTVRIRSQKTSTLYRWYLKGCLGQCS